MDPAQLAVFALLIGVILGGSAVLLVATAYRMRDRAAVQATEDIPPGARDVLAGMDDAAVVVNPSGTVLAASMPAEAYGLVVGKNLPDDQLMLLLRAARAGTASAPLMMRLHRGRTQVRDVSARAQAISGRLVLLVLRDVTEQERLEQMRRDFVANTSHELKTPVGAVSLLAEAVESAADEPDRVRDFAQRLRAEAERLAGLITRIMSLSQLQSDQPVQMHDVGIDELVDAAVGAQRLPAAAAGVELVRGAHSGAFVRGDAQELGEAIDNLIANAVAYSPAGSHVGIGVKVEHGVVEIAVADQGIGIAEDDQERIFERFYRADQARSRRTGGTGLGLAIVKHAVQRHGGEVRLWSRPGQGSTFTIRLPEAPAPEPNRPGKHRGKVAHGGKAKTKKSSTKTAGRKDTGA
ncbi:ATP-binding protein [Microbacterium kribbense]|uniref:Sensor-like histidine kinase SenX3 n=1 Tax=Microbacterium kribbense TaxID=433645 RepID=A0ABP7GBY6_9MICO